MTWLSCVLAQRNAAAEQVAVAVDVVNATYRRPVLDAARYAAFERSADFARVGPVPFGGHQAVCRVRRVLERVVVLWPSTVFHLPNFFADGDHGVDEAVQLLQCFAFG